MAVLSDDRYKKFAALMDSLIDLPISKLHLDWKCCELIWLNVLLILCWQFISYKQHDSYQQNQSQDLYGFSHYFCGTWSRTPLPFPVVICGSWPFHLLIRYHSTSNRVRSNTLSDKESLIRRLACAWPWAFATSALA